MAARGAGSSCSGPARDPDEPDEQRFAATAAAVTSAFGGRTRREIYLYVRSHPAATASQVAAAFSLHPNVARHHLDRLATCGYLQVSFERSPLAGAGRPSKRFRVPGEHRGAPPMGLLGARDDLLVSLLAAALQHLGPDQAEGLAERVGEEHGRRLAARVEPKEGQRSVRSAMHAVADALTAHGFAAHAEELGSTTAVISDHCPFENIAAENPVICAVERGMVRGLLAGLCGGTCDAMPVVLSSRARGGDTCATAV